jgi:hypothetical protein
LKDCFRNGLTGKQFAIEGSSEIQRSFVIHRPEWREEESGARADEPIGPTAESRQSPHEATAVARVQHKGWSATPDVTLDRGSGQVIGRKRLLVLQPNCRISLRCGRRKAPVSTDVEPIVFTTLQQIQHA